MMHAHVKSLTAGAAALALAAMACFSEKGGVTDPGDCLARLDQGTVAGSTIVVIRDYEFLPAEVRVAPGAKVTWVNCGPFDSHTSTSNTGAWNSPLLAPGDVYTRTFSAAGSFDYHCAPHPAMQARVIVQ
jgi:plastocyanin